MPMKMLVLTWESRYTVLLAQWFSFTICVDFRNDDLVFGMRKCICELLINWGEALKRFLVKNAFGRLALLTLQ
jgi:hypothetical protein